MKLRVPHPFVLLFGLVVLAAIGTWFLPAGQYDRHQVQGRSLVDPGSYHELPRTPAGVPEILLAFPRGLQATATIVFYIFLIGGTFGVLQATGALEAGIGAIVAAARGRGEVVLPLLVFVFALGGGTIGMAEETLPFLPGLVLLARRLGYDELIAGAVALAGAGAGFSGAFLNPFTIGVAHGITGLPLFSGVGFRLGVWSVLTLATMLYIGWAARRHRVPVDESAPSAEPARVGGRQLLALAALGIALVLVVVGSFRWGWGLVELAALFLGVAIVAGAAAGLGGERIATSFLEGASGLSGAALVVGLARGVLVILDGARNTDAILHSLAGAVAALPSWATVFGIYVVQVLLSYFVPSASGQAALSLPILAPLGDLVGVTRQTSVLAYQFGDGFSNVFTPTSGYFMAGLALIGVPWTRWAKFLWPLQVIWLVIGLVSLAIAHAIHYGPF